MHDITEEAHILTCGSDGKKKKKTEPWKSCVVGAVGLIMSDCSARSRLW